MKEIQLTKYVANDGCIFSNKDDCIDYENNLANNDELIKTLKVLTKLKNISPMAFDNKIEIMSLNPLLNDYSKQYLWIIITDRKDFEYVIKALSHDIPNSYLVKQIRPPVEFPNIMILEEYLPSKNAKYRFSGKYRYYSNELNEIKSYKQAVQTAFDNFVKENAL